MLISIKGLVALRQLRLQFQEAAGDDFPQAVLTEMLVLYDVCECLELNIFQARDVLGEYAWACVTTHIQQPASVSVNWERVNHVDGAHQG